MVQSLTHRRGRPPGWCVPQPARLPLGLRSVLLAPTLLLSLLALMVAGCGSKAPPVSDAFFRLEPVLAVSPAPRPLAGTAMVTPLGARGFLGGTQILFTRADTPLQARRYDDLLWEEAPGRAIAGSLVAALRATGRFEFVVTLADRARADWLIGGELTRFEHLPTADPPRVAAAFSLSLVRGRDRQLLFVQTYAGEEPTGAGSIGDATPAAMAAAFNRLTGQLLAAAIADLGTATRRLTDD